MTRLGTVALSLLALGLSSCGGGGGSSCVEGTTQTCACAGGLTGVQACSASGIFGPCDCGGGLDAGRPDGATEDGGADSGMMVGTGETVTAMVGVEGGTVELENATLTVPAGALATPTMITVTETTMPTPAGYRAFSPLYRFEPEGLVFEAPVTVAIRSNASGADVPLGTLFWSRDAADGGGWERRGGIPGGGEVEGQVTHFSFGFIADGVDYTAAPDTSCVRTRVLDTRTLPPSGVGLFFAMDDCWGRPITDLSDANIRVYEDDMALSSEASASLFEQRGLQVFITLAIDVSASTRPVLSDVIAAARSFVETLNEPARGLRDRVQVAVVGFAGEASPGFQQTHTLDLDLVLRRLDELATYEPSDVSSTNLHGAVQYALSLSSGAQRNFRDRNRGGAFTAGYVALFTDGGDTAGRVPFETARMTLEQSPDDVIALGLRGDDYDPAALRTLVGDFAVYDAESTVVLDRDFRHIAARIAGQVRRSYLLGYCSPKRSGMHTVYASHRDAVERRVWGAPPTFDARSFTGGCNPAMFDPTAVCGGAECGGFGCGACDDRVATCDAAASSTSPGVCVSNCIARNFCSGEMFTNAQGYEQSCPMTAEQTLCGGSCVDTTRDVGHCGACSVGCPPGISCSSGRCACPASEPERCESSAGAECVNIQTDARHCGVCGASCPSGIDCVAGRCDCPPDTPDVCSNAGAARCVNLNRDLRHCGTCGTVCPTSYECAAGDCLCPAAAPTECAGRCVDTITDRLNCGSCGFRCPSGVTCAGGSCDCPSGLPEVCESMTGVPVCVNPDEDIYHCGRCGNRCFCIDGSCGSARRLGLGAHSCAVLTTGDVMCWGYDGVSGTRLIPRRIPGIVTATDVAAGQSHTCVLESTGEVKCWGLNTWGEIGDGTRLERSSPTLVVGLTDAVQVDSGYEHSCAVRATGAVVCWGRDDNGQVSNYPRVNGVYLTPLAVDGLNNAVQVAAGAVHTCALRSDDTVVCWGGTRAMRAGSSPRTPIPGLVDASALASFGSHTCALRRTGAVVCWGDNSSGQLGTGFPGGSFETPQAVVGLADAVEIAAGASHSCARRRAGTVVCWGANNYGQLGDGTRTTRAAPMPVPGLTGSVEISAGVAHNCSRLDTGGLMCWGLNNAGAIGDNTTGVRDTPVSIP